MTTRDPRDVVHNEFACYYQADEAAFAHPVGFEEWVDDSARRFVHTLGEGARDAVRLLENVARGQDDDLLEALDRETQYAWRGSDEDWALFHRIVGRIAATVEQEVASRASTRP